MEVSPFPKFTLIQRIRSKYILLEILSYSFSSQPFSLSFHSFSRSSRYFLIHNQALIKSMILSDDIDKCEEILTFSNASVTQILNHGKGHPLFNRKLCLRNFTYQSLMHLQQQSNLLQIQMLKYDESFERTQLEDMEKQKVVKVKIILRVKEITCLNLAQISYLRRILSPFLLQSAKLTLTDTSCAIPESLVPVLSVRNLTLCNTENHLQLLTSVRPTRSLTIQAKVDKINMFKLKNILSQLNMKLSEINLWCSKQTVRVNHLEEFDRYKLAERQYIGGDFLDEGIFQNSTGPIGKRQMHRQMELIKKYVKIGEGLELNEFTSFLRFQKEIIEIGFKKIIIGLANASEFTNDIIIIKENVNFIGEIVLNPKSLFMRRDYQPKVIMLLLRNYPNMKGLKILRDSYELSLPQTFNNVNSNLESFSIIGLKSSDVTFCRALLSSSKATLKDINLQQTYANQNRLFDGLTNSTQLQTLSICADCTHPEDMKTISTFTNLKTLILHRSPHMYQAFFETHFLGALGNLEYLTLYEPLPDLVKAFQGEHKSLRKLKYDTYLSSKSSKLNKGQVEAIVKGKREGFVLEGRFEEDIVCERAISKKLGFMI
ncbi:hypothetical protein FGO68_gene5621 [Halteria grandinella]|uniref:Uncharacterized protein n=1 Tax=Halteria grandinella TaxID=5974 RepID=A0A8J8T8A6_HALGN|nr:hypothetical protein FGO68_gene5621 [Halteria grandinella]